jgi:outer membrane receptor protein involved in Fe transport
VTGNPVGAALPAFTTHSARAGVTLLQNARLVPRFTISIDNLTDALYAEASNVSFFRPEPRRRVTLQSSLSF